MTEQEIHDRMDAYEQAIMSLDGNWFVTDSERKQGKILQASLRKQADRWFRKSMDRIEKKR